MLDAGFLILATLSGIGQSDKYCGKNPESSIKHQVFPYFWGAIKLIDNMNIPDGLKYTKDHEWVKINGNQAIVGITDFAQGELGDIVYVDITSVGQEIDEHGVFGTVEAVKTVSDLFMPIKGKVLEVNPILDGSPEKVNEDPYGEGWMVKVEVKGSIDKLLTAAQYKELIGK